MYFRYMLYTVGYSGFSPNEFLHALRSRGVEVLADVRRFPRSKTGFYSGENLREALQRVGVENVWFGELGALGVRGPAPAVPRRKLLTRMCGGSTTTPRLFSSWRSWSNCPGGGRWR